LTALLTLALTAALGLANVPAAEAKALPKRASTCTGVWVVVDRGNGSSTVRCATSYATGMAALKSAGFTVKERSAGFICQIHAYPGSCKVTNTGYWSYWHATLKSDGTWSSWTYSAKGANTYKPSKAVAEGWRYISGSSKAPGVKPPKSYSKSAAPKISGTAKVGKILRATASFKPKPSYSYQWYRGSAKIAGATKSSYTLRKADRGKTVKVKVTAKKSGFPTLSKTSTATKKVK
jgi:hypothetical protein